MRPPAPPNFNKLLAERWGISKLLNPAAKMIVRRLETNRLSTFLSVLGMSLAVAVLVLGSYMQSMIDYIIEFQFQLSQRHDVMLTFAETTSADAVYDSQHLPGVKYVESFRSVPVRLHNGNHEYRLGLMGLEPTPELFRVLDINKQPISFPQKSGLTISEKLAELLDVQNDDTLEVELLDGSGVSFLTSVAKIFKNFSEPAAYLNRQQLYALLREGERHNGMFLAVDRASMENFYREVKQMPSVAAVVDKSAAEKSFSDIVSGSSSLMRSINAIFSGLIATGVIYNCAVIILAERARDLATLRVMGFRRREVAKVLLGELAVITIIAIPIGLPLGYGLCWLTTLALDTETHRFPLIVKSATFAYATVVILLTTALSALYVRRMLNKLDLLSVLKVKE